MKDICVVYLTHNRGYYTGLTLPRVIDECKQSERFSELLIFDDDSKDGTDELIKSLKDNLPFVYTKGKWGNTIAQFNLALKATQAKYIYYIGNDALIPEGVFDEMALILDERPDVMSAMVDETDGLPFILSDYNIEEHSFTSSAGIHRVSCFHGDLTAEKRFFGFQPYQAKMMRQHKYKSLRVHHIGMTNLDMSPWSKQNLYAEKGYSRTGLVSTERSVFKTEL